MSNLLKYSIETRKLCATTRFGIYQGTPEKDFMNQEIYIYSQSLQITIIKR